THDTWRRKFRGKSVDGARFEVEVNLQCGIEFKEASKFRLPQIIEACSVGVLAPGDREIILELILRLVRLLRHVRVRAKSDGGGKYKGRDLLVGVNQIIPVLITDRGGVDHCAAKRRVQRDISQ